MVIPFRWLAVSEVGPLADEDEVRAAGKLLVDLQDLPLLAVLPVGGLRAGVFQRKAAVRPKLVAVTVSGGHPVPVVCAPG
jgi:hypothetical protein